MDVLKVYLDSLSLIEDNLTNEDLNIEFLAKRLYISVFYFQRIFLIYSDKNAGTYIRERRLTEAGQDLKNNESIIDVALKYGYDSQESFSKAFKRFHGVTPREARNGKIISCVPKINVEVKTEGGIRMDFTIEKEKEFEIVILVKEFDEETSFKLIPVFWDEYVKKGYHKVVPPMLGVCLSNDVYKAEPGKFAYGIGSVAECCSEIPEGFKTLKVPEGVWGKFYTRGAMPTAIQNLWKEIYKSWLPSSGYEVVPGYDFECYDEGDTSSSSYRSGIWLRLKKK